MVCDGVCWCVFACVLVCVGCGCVRGGGVKRNARGMAGGTCLLACGANVEGGGGGLGSALASLCLCDNLTT